MTDWVWSGRVYHTLHSVHRRSLKHRYTLVLPVIIKTPNNSVSYQPITTDYPSIPLQHTTEYCHFSFFFPRAAPIYRRAHIEGPSPPSSALYPNIKYSPIPLPASSLPSSSFILPFELTFLQQETDLSCLFLYLLFLCDFDLSRLPFLLSSPPHLVSSSLSPFVHITHHSKWSNRKDPLTLDFSMLSS